jgi:hypothetical protein
MFGFPRSLTLLQLLQVYVYTRASCQKSNVLNCLEHAEQTCDLQDCDFDIFGKPSRADAVPVRPPRPVKRSSATDAVAANVGMPLPRRRLERLHQSTVTVTITIKSGSHKGMNQYFMVTVSAHADLRTMTA